jgi:hypothetical protein
MRGVCSLINLSNFNVGELARGEVRDHAHGKPPRIAVD